MSETATPTAASWPKYALPKDTTINGYRIERVLGSGGFGVTYLARDLLGQLFAIKEYFPRQFAIREDLTVVAASAEDTPLFEECRDRFLREAQALVLLGRRARAEDGIVRVQTYFEAHGTCFMVMDFIEGKSLASVLQGTPGGMEAAPLRDLMTQLLSSLRVVHEAGLMHRDIKPANVILNDLGRAVLIDFGSSREASSDLNTAYTQIYSGGYAPPEQMLGLPQGAFSDLYAVGAVCYQAIGGKVMDALARRNAVSAGRPDPMVPAANLGAGRYPALLLSAIDAALAVDPAARPQTVDAMLALLDPADEATIVVPSRHVISPIASPVPPQVAALAGRSRGVLAGVAAGASLLVLASVGYFIFWKPAPPARAVVAALAAPPAAEAGTGDASAAPAAAPPPPAADPAPIAVSAVPPEPPRDPGREAGLERQLERVSVLEQAREIAETLPCSVLTVKRGADGPTVSGLAPPGEDLERLLAKLREDGDPADEITRVDRSHCATITTVAALVRQSWNSVPRTFAVEPAQRDVTKGDRAHFTIRTVLPALIVDVYQTDGTVYHLSRPVAGSTPGRFHAQWTAGHPGPRLIVAIASERPLDLGTRPEVEDTADYLEALRARLDATTMELTADATTVTVRPPTETE